jgi:biofilm PGA synthesis lipoprotein PgaB
LGGRRHRAAAAVAALLLLIGAACARSAEPGPGPATDPPHAVVLLYHHVDDDTPPSTSVTPERFEAHLAWLEQHGYTVRPLAEVLAGLRGETPLPPRSVALTFDDGYVSVHDVALPLLRARDLPFSVFVNTDAVDGGHAATMSWDQLRAVEAAGGRVGNHSATHAHLVRRREGEDGGAWRARVRADLLRARRRLHEELAAPLDVLAYPYGEFDADLEALVAELGWPALGQQSGPAGPSSSPTALPRFPMAAAFAALPAFAEKLRTRPLPATVRAPARRVLPPGAPAPTLVLSVGPEVPLDRLVCYVAGQDPARIERREGRVVAITARAPLGAGRSKYTCTAPAGNGVFYWYSHLWIQPRDDGSWYEG